MKGLLQLALLSLTTVVNAKGYLRNEDAWKAKRQEVFQKKIAEADMVSQKKPKDQYLTKKSQKFAVDSTSLPKVTYDFESYAGLLPVDDTGKELFFWFVPSENPEAKDEITIWLNGGPGCSSLDGFFHENGPITWMAGTYAPVKSHYGWNNLTNIVWVDQPVSTGYSQGKPNATNEYDVADQFNAWWKNFVDTFDLHNRKVYIAGESYAGMYVPYIGDGMLKKKDNEYYNLQGSLIYDPVIGHFSVMDTVPTLAFVERNPTSFPFDDKLMADLRNTSKACGFDDFMEEALTFPPKGPLPPAPKTPKGCRIFAHVFNAVFNVNPCFDIYQVSQICPLLWDTEGFPYSDFYLPKGYKNPYFNHTAVKKALNVPLDDDWSICGGNPFPHGDNTRASGLNNGPVAHIAEATGNMIVAHGALDMVLISEGSLMTLNNLTWNGKQGYSTAPNNDFYVPYHDDPRRSDMAGAGIFGKWVSERGLTFVHIEAAGHMVPEFQPAAGYRNFELLLGRISNMSEVSAFSTQPGYPQPKRFKNIVHGSGKA